jgi:hypothetical protein
MQDPRLVRQKPEGAPLADESKPLSCMAFRNHAAADSGCDRTPVLRSFPPALPGSEFTGQASEDEVLELWAGLGYYRRARNLLKAAGLISKKGIFRSDLKEILTLPGVVKYTAGAICSLAFEQPEPVVDGNVRRVISRLAGIRRRVSETFFWSQMRWANREGAPLVSSLFRKTLRSLPENNSLCCSR